jgi:hypothetical protein
MIVSNTPRVLGSGKIRRAIDLDQCIRPEEPHAGFASHGLRRAGGLYGVYIPEDTFLSGIYTGIQLSYSWTAQQ